MDTFSLSKNLGLTPKNAKQERSLYYKGIFSKNEFVPCRLIEEVCDCPAIVRIDIGQREIDISLDKLKEIQPTKKAMSKMIRPFKGKSLLTFPYSFTVIDIETTGLDSRKDSIIELAGIKVENDKIIDKFCEYVNPMVHIPSFISDLTHISDSDVCFAPDIEELLPKYLSFIGEDIILGHNVNFDINFIYDNCQRLGFPPFSNNFVDTLKLSRKLYPEWEHHRLCDMAQNLNVIQKDYHRALADCETTLLCYNRMKKERDFL